MEDQEAEAEAKKIKEDDVVTWTGKKLSNYEKRVGHLAKQNTESEGLIVDTLEAQEPVKKKPKAGGFGNFSGW